MKKQMSSWAIFILCILVLSNCNPEQDSDDTNNDIAPFKVTIHDSTKAFAGTTLFTTDYDNTNPMVIKVNMIGEIVWQYNLPDEVNQFVKPGFDAEQLDNGNILIVLPGYGLYEVDQNGTLIWSHQDPKISHDADRLPSGNTLYVYGDNDTKGDDIAKEVDSQGNLVWSWSAKAAYNVYPYNDIYFQGWTHANAVIRRSNGNTLISLRNFDLTVEVNPAGTMVWSFDWSQFGTDVYPHEPEITSSGTILVALQNDSPYIAVEINKTTGQTVWTYARDNIRTTRDADRLPNGNTLLVAVDTSIPGQESLIFEVTPVGEVVWEFRLKGYSVGDQPGYFYKAQRI